MDPRPAPGRLARHPRATIAVLGYCGGLVSVSQTVSLPLLPILPEALNTSISNVSWVATASFLTGAVANPVLGRLGDMHGKRRTMILAMAILAAGCLIAAVAPNILVLVIARALQGFGTAVLPLAMSIAKDTLPPAQMTQGVALVSATLGIGSGLGLPLSGLLLGWFDWHAVFWVVLVLTLLGIALMFRFVPDPDPQSSKPGRFDVVGAVWLSACLVAILLPISKSASWGWLEPLPLTLFALGIGGLFGWARYERRPEQPLVDVALMRQRPLVVINVAGVLLGFAMFSNMYISLVQLQTTDLVDYGFGASAVLAGLVLLPGALAMMFTSPISARIIDTRGPRAAMIVGATVMGVSYVLRLAMLHAIWQIALGVLLVNAGVGIAYGAFPSAIMANVPPSETASANAMGTLTRAGGAALSSAVIGALLGSLTQIIAGEEIASLEAFQYAFVLSALASLVAAGVAIWLPDPVRDRARRRVRTAVARS
jgi:MFS family permease